MAVGLTEDESVGSAVGVSVGMTVGAAEGLGVGLGVEVEGLLVRVGLRLGDLVLGAVKG